MPRFLFILLLLSSVARAHVGLENDTEVRVLPDQMRVVIRTSQPFAQTLLGSHASLADEAGQAAARPLLATAAADLISITSAGETMTPTGTDCVFEAHNDVAFILTFPRPVEWPVVVKAEFFPRLGNLESGTLAVFDCTASRFSREVEPLVKRIIDPRKPAVSFTLEPTGNAPAAVVVRKRESGRVMMELPAVLIFLTAAAVVFYLARRRWLGIHREP